MADNSAPADMPAVTKTETGHDNTPSSIESTPDRDPEVVQDQTQPQKRKGGRKPIYATSEERKQRNRQAQAAFRERRTEYIKQLETTIKHHEEALQSLQQSHRSAADEVLMLRYKNSLLERILLEKGIDVQTELQAKTGSPSLAPTYLSHAIPPPMAQPALQRTALSRQHARRSGQGFAPRLGPGPNMAQPSHDAFNARSPQGQPTPSSHASSPTALSQRSPISIPQGGMTPPTSAVLAQPQQQQYRSQAPPRSQYMMQNPAQQRPQPPSQYPSSSGMSSISASTQAGGMTEQEYDAAPTIDEHDTSDQSVAHGPEPGQYQQQQFPQVLPYAQQPPMQPKPPMQNHEAGQHSDAAGSGPGMNQLGFDPYDPMLDADPFGLSASMHFPTSYSFDQPPQR